MHDKHAFWLACGCLIALAGFSVTDICLGGLKNSEILSGLTDMLKYVAATSLGFFFASSVRKKDS